MPHRPRTALHPVHAVVLLVAILGLAACGDLAAALPPRPSPFPTLEHLPSVTPVTPSPTAPATPTAVAIAGTPTPTLFQARSAVTANMRSGPGVDFVVIMVVDVGTSIDLLSRQGEWYEVRTPDDQRGWMSSLVLDIDPAIADAVPAAQP